MIKKNENETLYTSIVSFKSTEHNDSISPHIRETTFCTDDEQKHTKNFEESPQEVLRSCMDLEETNEFLDDAEHNDSNFLNTNILVPDCSMPFFCPTLDLRPSHNHPKFCIIGHNYPQLCDGYYLNPKIKVKAPEVFKEAKNNVEVTLDDFQGSILPNVYK